MGKQKIKQVTLCAEEVTKKKLFANGIQCYRAIIPAAHFYEWSANREKNTFSRLDREPLHLAGFFDVLGNEERFVILTTRASASMRRVHDRMPLVLEQDPWEWREIIARTGEVAYGKFFGGKSGFVSKEWFQVFANYRRDG